MRKQSRARMFIVAIIMSLSVVISSASSVFAIDGKYDATFYKGNDILFYNPEEGASVSGCSASGEADTPTELSGADNREKIWNYFLTKGLTAEQTAGVMGNLQTESGGSWSPTVNEGSQAFGSGGYGLVQWTGGRRTTLIDVLKDAAPTTFATYYNADYSFAASYSSESEGFIPKSAATGDPMATEDNDAFLLAELDHIYDEASSRNLGSKAVQKGLGVSSDTEWDAIKKETTVEGASNVWLYSYEVPGEIAHAAITPDFDSATGAQRIINGKDILSTYSSECDEVGGDKKALAQSIIDSGNISYWDNAGQNKTKEIIDGIAAGTNNGNDDPCGMNMKILQIVAAITERHKLTINDSNRKCSGNTITGVGSRHWNGNGSAIDIGDIDGISAHTKKGADLIVDIASPYLVRGSNIGQSQAGCVPVIAGVPAGVGRFTDGCTHLHIDVPPDADPDLICTKPDNAGACTVGS